MVLKFYIGVAEDLILKARKFLELIPTVVEVTGEKLIREPFSAPSSPLHSHPNPEWG